MKAFKVSTGRKTSSQGNNTYEPTNDPNMTRLISELNSTLTLTTSSNSKPNDIPYVPSPGTSENSPITSCSASGDLISTHCSTNPSQILPPPKEQFNPEDEQTTKAYDILAQQCGAGSTSKLQKSAKIRRLLSTCDVYSDIVNYMNNSSDGKVLSVKNIYKIERFDDENIRIFEPYRILLWHGTSPGSIPGIIETGFRKGKGGMFGGGIYFADRIAKSLVYTEKSKVNGSGFLILAEILPGKVYKAHHFHTSYKKSPKGFDSVKGNGADIPLWKDNRDYFGAIMPVGVTVPNQRHASYDMKYNEYIVYDMNRVKVKFVVECTF